MNETHTRNADPDGQAAQEVEDYLRTHPDFFDRRHTLLAEISVPHPAHGVVSLIERQVELLRERNRQLEAKLVDLVAVARENEALSSRLHRLALALMDSEDINDVVNTTVDLLRNEFPATPVVVRILTAAGEMEAVPSEHFMDIATADALFDSLFAAHRPLCGGLDPEQKAFLFGDAVVRSAVLVPLSDGRRLGVLALGSLESDRFHSGMGTLFLGHLGELVSRALKGHLLN